MKSLFLSAVCFSVLSAPAVAQDASATAGYIAACREDVATYCAGVRPGDGRIASCLYAHSATISDACYEETSEFGRRLEAFFDLVTTISLECEEDLATHCADVAAGGGARLSCLRDVAVPLRQQCDQTLSVLNAISTE